MSAQTPQSQQNIQTADNKPSDKEINFRLQEKAIADKYERQLAIERQGREKAESEVQRLSTRKEIEEEDDEDEPYVAHKKLDKKLARFGEKNRQETQSDIQRAVKTAIEEERKQTWLKSNGDFYDVLQHAEKLAQKDPDLADSILAMPEGFERKKLVYNNIKALNLHKPEVKQSTIQDKVDANRKGPYYQPSGVGSAAYQSAGDFSATGQKSAYDKMQELKNRLRLG